MVNSKARGLDDKLFDLLNYTIMALVGLSVVFPLMYVVAVSITPMSEVLKNGGFIIIPRSVTFEAYSELLRNPTIPRGFLISITVTAVGTLINLVITTLMAYPLSRKTLPGRGFFLMLVVFTMLFYGGMIPTYLIVKATGLLNTLWALMIPNAVAVFNLLIMKSFFENLPNELLESARIDGAKELRVLSRIVLPMSMPVMMTIGLFYMVEHWNDFFSTIMYITDRNLYPLQVLVRNILMRTLNPIDNPDVVLPTEAMQMAAVIVASAPIIIVYPFIQRYFVQGMMIGSIKG